MGLFSTQLKRSTVTLATLSAICVLDIYILCACVCVCVCACAKFQDDLYSDSFSTCIEILKYYQLIQAFFIVTAPLRLA